MSENAASPTQESGASSTIWFWLFTIILLTPWIYVQSQTSVNSDVAWLSICAERILNGGTFVADCFDTNPPLSTLIYIPFIWFSELSGIDTHHVIFWMSLGFICLGTTLTYKLLRLFPFLNENERLTLCVAYLFTITIIPTIYYAERDHYLAIMLMPLILLQMALTWKLKPHFLLTLITLVLGGVTLLLKPHYGLIPLVMLLHRIKVQKRIWGVLHVDTLILGALTGLYVVSVITFFPDFVSIMLPDITQTYIGYNDFQGTYQSALPYGVLIIVLGILSLRTSKEFGAFIKTLWFCSLISLILYLIQMKGFTYQRLPIYTLLFPTLSVLLLHPLILVAKKPDNKSFAVFMLFAIASISYIASPLRPSYATHDTYLDNDVTRYIDKHCSKPCAFYMTHNNMDIISQLGFYSQHTYATRFPSFWFMTSHARLSEEDATAKTIKFGNYIAEDIQRYQPSLLFILAKTEDQGEFNETENVMSIFEISDKFKDAVAPYKKIDRLTIDRAYFYKDTPYDFPYEMAWDVYKKDETE